ncbi:DUF3951 domain-containing protein [Paenibacillus gansuensis]|uniref:DUF3951 domain-containing protein n=1 Tax=Paenibacillus gansuensis TaxID=306542 RepID=A0ABW5P7I2_9BACL
MDFGAMLTLSLLLPIVLLLVYILVKMATKKEIPESNYTPLDFIMGQTPIEFHEEKKTKEEQEGQGEDK